MNMHPATRCERAELAESLKDTKNRKPAALVYQALIRAGKDGLTDDEIDERTPKHVTQNSTRPRRVNLVEAGLVADSRKTRPSRSGRKATVWVAKEVSR